MIHTLAVWDLDDTLVDTALRNTMSKGSFFSPGFLKSAPAIDMNVSTCKQLCDNEDVDVMFVTGRPDDEKTKDATVAWLNIYALTGHLFLRPQSVGGSSAAIAHWKATELHNYLVENYKGTSDHKLRTVLVWDDNTDNLISMKGVLQPTGLDYTLFQVIPTTTGHTVKVYATKSTVRRKKLQPVDNNILFESVDKVDGGEFSRSQERR